MADAESLVESMKELAVDGKPQGEQAAPATPAEGAAAAGNGDADDDGEVAATREVATELQETTDDKVKVEVQDPTGLLGDMSLKDKDGQQITWERLFAGLVSEERSAQLCRACGEKGWRHPARVQRCLRAALNEKHPGVLVHAKNGSGKTGCFALACLGRVDLALKKPQAVVVCPNRLVVKNAVDTIRKLASQLVDADGQPAISVAEAVKGKKLAANITDQIIVATPGRLMLLVDAGKAAAKAAGGGARRRRGRAKKERSTADLSQVKVLAVDEADEMMELSEDALRSLVRLTPQAQTMLFSASFDELTGGAIKAFTDDLLRAKQVAPFRAVISDVTIPRLTQYLVKLPGSETREKWIQRMLPFLARTGPVFLFANTKRHVRACGEQSVPGVKLSWVSSDRDDYHKVLDQFASRKLNAVVSTNMGARGVDIANLNVVVNLWPCTRPGGAGGQVDHKAFQHRCGRTARFGRPGVVLNVATAEEEPLVRELVCGRSVFRYELHELPTDGQQALDAIHAALEAPPADAAAAAGGGSA